MGSSPTSLHVLFSFFVLFSNGNKINTFHMSETWPMRVSQMLCTKKKTIQERDNLDNEEKNLHTINLTKD